MIILGYHIVRSKNQFFFALITALFWTGSLSALERKVAVELVRAGDAAHSRADYPSALVFYQEACKKAPANYEAAWKLARAYVDVGEKQTEKQERRSLYEKACHVASKAVEVNPDGSKGHLYVSIALGRLALEGEARERVRLSGEIKRAVDRALAIDPQDDIAWHVLGRWHRRVSSISWIEKKFAGLFYGGVPKEASMEKAAECFKKAIQLNDNHINHHLELALTYERLGKRNLAVIEYQKVMSLPGQNAGDQSHKAVAERKLEAFGYD